MQDLAKSAEPRHRAVSVAAVVPRVHDNFIGQRSELSTCEEQGTERLILRSKSNGCYDRVMSLRKTSGCHSGGLGKLPAMLVPLQARAELQQGAEVGLRGLCVADFLIERLNDLCLPS